MQTWIENYVAAQTRALASVPTASIEQAIETVGRMWLKDQQIFCIGNGAGAASASHFAVDLGKGTSDHLSRRFRVMSLTDNMPWMTALANDYAYEEVFTRQLQNYARPGDLLIALSVSGNSSNCVHAIEWAMKHEMETLAIIGGQRGKLNGMSTQTIIVEDTHFGRVEDLQMNILHMICYALAEKLKSATA